jgi:hypothetical protein
VGLLVKGSMFLANIWLTMADQHFAKLLRTTQELASSWS